MSDIHESTGSYALNALDAAELTEFEAHLATCATCQDEFTDFCETAAQLSLLTPATPPSLLRNNVLDAIRTTPQLSEGDQAGPTRPAASNGSRPGVEALRAVRPTVPRRALPDAEVPDEPAVPEPEPVDELGQRRQRRRTRILSGLVAAMLALAVGLGGVVYTLVQQRQTQIAAVTLEQELYRAPDAVQFSDELAGGGQVTFVASKQLNRAVFIGTHLPDPGRNRYQLWTGTGDLSTEEINPVRDNQVVATDSGVKVFFSGNVAGSDFLAVNLEPAGSTPTAPTTPVLAAAPI